MGVIKDIEVGKYDLSVFVVVGKGDIRTYRDKQYIIQQYPKSYCRWVSCMAVDKNGDENETAQLLKIGVIHWLWRMIHGRWDEKLTFFKNGVINRMTTWRCFQNEIICELINDERATNACCWRRCNYAVLWSIKDRMIMLSWEELDGEWNMMRV